MEGYIAEIRMFAGNFAPQNWAFCNGQTMSIQQNAALFSLLGTTYGGNGQTTFGLPDLRGRVPVHTGYSQGPGLTPRSLGATFGAESVTLLPQQMPAHASDFTSIASVQTTDRPGPGLAPAPGGSYGPVTSSVPGQVVGDYQPHDNIQPSLGMNFIICITGIYPTRD